MRSTVSSYAPHRCNYPSLTVGALFDEVGALFDEVGALFDEVGTLFDEAHIFFVIRMSHFK